MIVKINQKYLFIKENKKKNTIEFQSQIDHVCSVEA
jgi:hypothetical protein